MNNTIYIKKIIGSDKGILHREGETLYQSLVEELKSNRIVRLDFTGINAVTTGFCASSIGKLFTESTDTGEESLVFVGIDDEIIMNKIENVINLAKDDTTLTRYCDSLNSLLE